MINILKLYVSKNLKKEKNSLFLIRSLQDLTYIQEMRPQKFKKNNSPMYISYNKNIFTNFYTWHSEQCNHMEHRSMKL